MAYDELINILVYLVTSALLGVLGNLGLHLSHRKQTLSGFSEFQKQLGSLQDSSSKLSLSASERTHCSEHLTDTQQLDSCKESSSL